MKSDREAHRAKEGAWLSERASLAEEIERLKSMLRVKREAEDQGEGVKDGLIRQLT